MSVHAIAGAAALSRGAASNRAIRAYSFGETPISYRNRRSNWRIPIPALRASSVTRTHPLRDNISTAASDMPAMVLDAGHIDSSRPKEQEEWQRRRHENGPKRAT